MNFKKKEQKPVPEENKRRQPRALNPSTKHICRRPVRGIANTIYATRCYLWKLSCWIGATFSAAGRVQPCGTETAICWRMWTYPPGLIWASGVANDFLKREQLKFCIKIENRNNDDRWVIIWLCGGWGESRDLGGHSCSCRIYAEKWFLVSLKCILPLITSYDENMQSNLKNRMLSTAHNEAQFLCPMSPKTTTRSSVVISVVSRFY